VRILFASTQGAGHFGPLVPFLDAALRRGHDVLVVGPPTLDPRSYPFRAGATPPEEVLGPLWGRMPSLPPGQGDLVVVGQIFGRLNVDAMLPTLRETIADWRPDVVFRETAEFASAIAADEAGVPHVHVAAGLVWVVEGYLGFAAPELEDARSGIGERIAASPTVTCWPASVDVGQADVRRFRDPAREVPPAPLPDWWQGDDRPLVYVTFGSVAAEFPPAAAVYRSALDAVADLGARILLTVGTELDVGPVPENVHVERWVPQGDVLGHAAAVVCHGGAGTTLGALAAGVPLVVVPLFADQPLNGARAAVSGAAVVASIDGIRSALERVLATAAYGEAAGRIAAELRALPPADEAFDSLDLP
jgi:hypothetical protein